MVVEDWAGPGNYSRNKKCSQATCSDTPQKYVADTFKFTFFLSNQTLSFPFQQKEACKEPICDGVLSRDGSWKHRKKILFPEIHPLCPFPELFTRRLLLDRPESTLFRGHLSGQSAGVRVRHCQVWQLLSFFPGGCFWNLRTDRASSSWSSATCTSGWRNHFDGSSPTHPVVFTLSKQCPSRRDTPMMCPGAGRYQLCLCVLVFQGHGPGIQEAL